MLLKRALRAAAYATPVLGRVLRQNAVLRPIVKQLSVLPGHYYSPLPNLDDIRRREARIFDRAPREFPGVALHEAEQLALLDELAAFYAEQPFPESPREDIRYHYDNEWFFWADGVVLYAMLRHLKPRRVIEIGSGYSSSLMLDVNERFFAGAIDLTFLEPYPERLYSRIRPGDRDSATILVQDLQELDLSPFEALQANDVLFIDSSHVAKTGSEVNYLFFEILPALAPGVYVHIHDVHYPFEYPREWVYDRRAWNEAYLVRAFLQYNERFRIAFWGSFLQRFHASRLREAMPLAQRGAAASLWLRKV